MEETYYRLQRPFRGILKGSLQRILRALGLGFLQELTVGFYKRVPFKGFLEGFFKVSGLGALVLWLV